MKRVVIGKHKVNMYESIEDMPMVRYKEYNKYLLIDSGIGSDTEDIDRSTDKIMAFINNKDKDNALKQLMLLKQNLYFAINGQSPKFMAFACLIESINNIPVIDLSIENLERVLGKFENVLTVGKVQSILETIKKKVENEMELYFPSMVDSAVLKEYYTQLQKRSLFVLKEIIEGKSFLEEISKIDRHFLTIFKPQVFHGKDSVELKYEKEFEEMCFIINQNINKEAKKLTVFEFYTVFVMLKKQNKPKKAKKSMSYGR